LSKIPQIIKIVDDKNLIINIGLEDGVAANEKFQIFEQGIEIVDPSTGEALGNLDFIKATVTAISVLPKMSICQSIKRTSTDLANIANLLTGVSITRTERESLDVDPEEISGGYEDFDKTIRIGDLVRKA